MPVRDICERSHDLLSMTIFLVIAYYRNIQTSRKNDSQTEHCRPLTLYATVQCISSPNL